jgi:Trp operon repressor
MTNNNNYILNYKEEMKDCQIITRIKIIKPILEKQISQINLAKSLNISKNTVNNIVKLFYQN